MFKNLLKPVTILFVLAQLLVLAVPALAQAPTPDLASLPAADVTIVTEEQSTRLAEIALQSEQFLQVAPDGTVTLNVDDAATLNVDQAFLEAYKAGLEELNELVRAGDLTINPDLTVVWNNELPADVIANPKAPADAQPDWAGYSYPSGALIYFNYPEVGRLPTHGLSFATTLGAHFRRSRTVPHFTHLFTRRFNHRVFRYHHYRLGTYFFTPWDHYHYPYSYKNIYFYRYSNYGRGYWVTSRVYY